MFLLRYTLVLLFCCSGSSLLAQPTEGKQRNQTVNGERQGFWQLKDDNDRIYAQGLYDQGKRTGPWKIYFSNTARYAHEADMLGNYSNDEMHGAWSFVERQSKVQIKGHFNQGVMEGDWWFTNEDGERLARGSFVNGVREGDWTIYAYNKPAGLGQYRNGVKVGQWSFNYHNEDSTVRYDANYQYRAGQKNGTLKIYKIKRSEVFEDKAYLIAKEVFQMGKPVGRWKSYHKGLRGEKVERGVYANGRKQDIWITELDGVKFEQVKYRDGKKNGIFYSYHDNGEVRFEGFYRDDLKSGPFRSFYPNGQLKEEGSYTLLTAQKSDSILYKVHLPIEYAFKVIQEPKFYQLNYEALELISDPEFSMDAQELQARYNQLLTYGDEMRLHQVKRRIRSVRVGEYTSYHANGEVELKGRYAPRMYKDPETGLETFAKDGTWEVYDNLGFLVRTEIYDKGELKEVKEE